MSNILKPHDLTDADEGRRLAVRDPNNAWFYGTLEKRVGGGIVFIWDVTNLPLGLFDFDELEFIDETE